MSAQQGRTTPAQMVKNFFIGGLSGMIATSCIQPIDMVKVRIQVSSESGGSTNPFKIAKEIGAQPGGIKNFYAGIDSALMRQAVYCTMRLGIYFNLSDYVKFDVNKGENLSVLQKTACSLTAGSIGSFFGNPCDLILVRMQADTMLPVEDRRNYTSFFNAFSRIAREEGVTSLWRGSVSTMLRACAMNVSMLVTYDTVKESLASRYPKDYSPFKMQVQASLCSAVVTCFCSLPFDNIKTKLQKQKALPDGTMPYKSIPDCVSKSMAREGITGFWAGLPTYYFRVGPHAIITLLASDALKRALM